MNFRFGFRSLAAVISFAAALTITAVGLYAMSVDGARHVWIPASLLLWITWLAIAIRDQFVERHQRLETKIDLLADDISIMTKRITDLHERFGALVDAVNEYGDRRQIAGHLDSIRPPAASDTQRLVAGSTSNVRSLPVR